MKTLAILLCIISLALLSYGQNIQGQYIHQQQHLSFSGDTVTYYLLSGGGVISENQGKGIYYIKNKRIFITPFLPKTKEFTLEVLERKNPDSCYFNIVSDSAIALPASVICFSNSKAIFGTSSNGSVSIAHRSMQTTDSVAIKCIGYKTATFKIKDDLKDYKISLIKGLDDESQIGFISNKGKGYSIRIKSKSLALKFAGNHDRMIKNYWVEFQKE